ncbi:hypothetical protein [Shouchella miscanthi]|uniref:Major facilitator superfamily (MFS) profile domain-containing protein n=1 Tax=Shouchella miscanthi TaxID=2598861 RepID=A0ABU6NN32_9BACI|nr:hypothetical protein [Shouchella miscanthi]
MSALMQSAIFPMTLIIPIVAGKLKDQRLLAIGTACSFLLGSIGLLFGVSLLLSSILLGLAGGSAFGLSIMFFSLRTSSSKQASQLSGMAQSIGYLLAAGGPIIVGWLYDLNGKWTLPISTLIFSSIVMIVAGLMAGKGYIDHSG